MKKRFIHTLIIVILISSILAFSYSIINIIKWNIANQKTKGKIEEINELVNIEETSDSSNTEIITNDDIEKNDPYWDYIKEDLINVDFQNLKEINSGVKGWIQVKGTNIIVIIYIIVLIKAIMKLVGYLWITAIKTLVIVTQLFMVIIDMIKLCLEV